MATPDAPLRSVLGGATAKALAAELGITTVGELLAHYPRRYAERGQLTPLAELAADEHVTVVAEIATSKLRPMKNRPGRMLEVEVTDGSGTLLLTYFGKPAVWNERLLRPKRRGLFAGKVTTFKRRRQLTHPDYLLLDGSDGDTDATAFVGALIPVYPATADLSSWQIAKAVQIALDVLDLDADPLPADVRARHNLVDLATALRDVHRPASRGDAHRAVERLKWDEALVLQATLAQRRVAAEALPAKPRPPVPGGLRDAFDARLRFDLTPGQRAIGEVLAADLGRPHPMHRLLQGEVGSGKTVVALRAMLTVVDAGGQAVLLAPTEVLAQQHHRSIRELLGPLGAAGELGAADVATQVALLTGSLPAARRRAALADVASGAAGIVVGTHALLEEDVRFADLGLVVVDEQHRFGVEQRDALRGKATDRPHVLVMTATPIPRTVAMTVYGDLETSTLTELPAGRAPVQTHVVPTDSAAWVRRMWGRVRDEVAGGRQGFVVCPRIGGGTEEEGAADDDGRRPAAAVLEVAPLLAAGELSGLRLAVLHGRLPAEEKDAVMRGFAEGAIDVLVATTVVEVGVDVPNATVMVILDADRYGVSQLHQLRGRVGRGSSAGWCLLHTDAAPGTPARERLDAVAATTDGFALARLDLEQRREGNVLGAEQAGRRSGLRLLSLLRDEPLIRAARDEASALVAADPELAGQPALARAVAALVAQERAEFLEKA